MTKNNIFKVIINEGEPTEIENKFETKKECINFVKELRQRKQSQTLKNNIKIKTWTIRSIQI